MPLDMHLKELVCCLLTIKNKNMKKLFNDDEFFVKERPAKLTKNQEEKIYKEMAQEVIDGGWSRSDIDDVVEDLSELSLSDNGFEMAKDLDDTGSYNIDTAFCEWLEGIENKIGYLIEKNVKEWVKTRDIKPQFTGRDKLKVLTDFSYKFKTGETIYITNIYADKALYVIHHNQDYQGGTLIPFEEVEKCCAAY
jgi:hypothetical protein